MKSLQAFRARLPYLQSMVLLLEKWQETLLIISVYFAHSKKEIPQ